MENNIELSKDAMTELLKLPIKTDKLPYQVEYKLQILTIRKNESKVNSQGKTIFTATLSDGDHKFNNFVIFKDDTAPEIDSGDIIKVTRVVPAIMAVQKSRVFIIKKFEMVEKNMQMINNPEPIIDNYISGVEVKVESSSSNENPNQTNLPGEGGKVIQSIQNNNNQSSTPANNNKSEENAVNQMKVENQDQNSNPNSLTPPINKQYFQPLASLTTFSKDIHILVKCVKKTGIRSFNGSSNNPPGNLFSFNVVDNEGSEMQITGFNRAVDKFFNLIKENSVYEIYGGYIKINDNKKFTHIKSEYKMIIYDNARIFEREDDGTFKETYLNYIKISEIATLQPQSIIDILGYVIEAPEKVVKVTRKGEQHMRKIIIADDTEYKIEFTLWKDFTNLEIKAGQVISVKYAKIGDYNGRNLTSVDHSVITLDPVNEKADELRNFCSNFQGEWLSFNDLNISQQEMNNISTPISTIKEVMSFLNNNPNISEDKIPCSKIKATICNLNHSEKNFYPGCVDKSCMKKAYPDEFNLWTCHFCKKRSEKPYYYYRFTMRIKDYSAEHWMDVFGDIGAKLFKIPGDEYKDLVFSNNEQALRDLTNSLEFKTFYFIVKPKLQSYNNITKKKLSCFKIETFEPAVEARKMMKNLNEVFRFKK